MTGQKVKPLELPLTPEEILNDYLWAYRSRQVSMIGRREVLSGRAKFGIFGDGKELPQLAMARVFRKGDFRAGYYRDQTFMFATGMVTMQEFFAQLYAHADVEAEPASAGRAMNAHFATRSLNPDGSWKNLTSMLNSASDLSPTGSQMPKLVGLGYASRLYRELEDLQQFAQFSDHGNEVAFATIGNASTAEGLFWEAVNAIGVLRAPVIISIWDDGYGISVPNVDQLVHEDISTLLSGFRYKSSACFGFEIYKVKGWDYPDLIRVYMKAVKIAREEHIPCIIHVTELTQPFGHSTSGSHERYKPKERLEWEHEYDCLKKFREWLLLQGICSEKELETLEEEDLEQVEEARRKAWEAYLHPIRRECQEIAALLESIASQSRYRERLYAIRERLLKQPAPLRRNIMTAINEALLISRTEVNPARQELIKWKQEQEVINRERYGSHLCSQSAESALKVPEVKPVYSDRSPMVYGFEVLNACFDAALARDPRVIAFGEDVGRLGDVNQAFKGLQEKYGNLRVSDTGIREATIVGQAIGLAMRGLRPIAEIQYLDYLLYALQIMSDDLATLHWRTKGGQKAPVIIRTRGHRLEGIWHSGSPMAGILNLVRGIYVLVPRNMTQAAGFYNTLLRADDPALVIEVLNGYRLRERLPDNIGEFTIPLGVPDVLRTGTDITIVTYGACCRIVLEACERLEEVGIQAEVIDVQTLLPFDLPGVIGASLQKTNRIVFVDEDVPGGATAFMLQQVLELQKGFQWLDSPPRTIPAEPHRPAYGSDGDYWSKPNAEQVFEVVCEMMHEVEPNKYPLFFR